MAVSNKTGMNLSGIYNVATFYKSFKLTAPAGHHVKLCDGTACHLKDTSGIAGEIEKKVSGSTKASVEKTLCLGCCDCAPVVEIDGKLYKGDEARAKIDSIVS